MEMVLSEECAYCKQEQVIDFKFCSNCGKRNAQIIKEEQQTEKLFNANLVLVSVYSLFTIVLLIIAAFTDDTLENLVIWTVCFAVIDIGFTLYQPAVWKLLKTGSVHLLPLASIILICICTGIVVSYSMDNLNRILFDEVVSTNYYFVDLQYPLLIEILMIAVCPAIFEEIAFRGFVYDNLQVISGEQSAIWGSAFLFGLVHFSLLSLVWIIPFGLFLAHFRRKYATLIYGIVGHFVHNTTTILIEYYDLSIW